MNGDNDVVYIVWLNHHFFVLKVQNDAFYVIDTLGDRLHERGAKSYILEFDKDTEIYEMVGPKKK